VTTTAAPHARPPAEEAAAAAARAGIRITPLSRLEEVQAAASLFCRIWRTGPDRPPLSVEVMRAVEHAGGYVAGAWAGTTLVGASAGFVGLEGTAPVLHSHISGVELAGRGIGTALKLHQRAWALDRGLGAVTWTFDPLVLRNAWFNLSKLGAVGVEHLVDFYGEMTDGRNSGEHSDRLLARWDLRAPVAPHDGHDGVVVLGARDGLPDPRSARPEPPWLVALPADIEALRVDDPPAAKAWRLAVREALEEGFARGLKARGTTRDGHVVLAR
jgi:predicted GNAT superfamily acetyltransferase